MIVYLACSVLISLLGVGISLSLPSLPSDVPTYVSQALTYLLSGLGLLRSFLGDTTVSYVLSLFSIVVALDTFYFSYTAFMWFLRKIPFFSVRQ